MKPEVMVTISPAANLAKDLLIAMLQGGQMPSADSQLIRQAFGLAIKFLAHGAETGDIKVQPIGEAVK